MPEATTIINEKLHVRVDTTDNTEELQQQIADSLDIDYDDCHFEDGYVLAPTSNWQKLDESVKARISTKANKEYVTFTYYPVIDGSVVDRCAHFTGVKQLLDKLEVEYDFDKNNRLQISIEELNRLKENKEFNSLQLAFPDRVFDVGIAEQHAVTFAAGLACAEAKPVVAIYSTFLQRAYDQLLHDVALQNLPVLFAIDRAGIVGADGPTHAGVYDLSYLRCVPNIVIAAPSDEQECRLLLSTCYALDQPTAVRYPRGTGLGVNVVRDLATVPVGKGILRRQGQRIALIAFGSMVQPALGIAEQLNATVADMRFVKPIDGDLLQELAQTHDYLVCLEENTTQGGAGSAVLESLAFSGCLKPTLLCGIPDIVTEHGDTALLMDKMGLSEQALLKRIEDWVAAQSKAA